MTRHDNTDASAIEILQSWSPYVGAFMDRRSMVTASLFPEKPAQLSFGYEYCAQVLPAITQEVAARYSAEDFGEHLRTFGTGHGFRLASALWTGSLGMLSRVLRDTGDVSSAGTVVDYWTRALAAHLNEDVPPWDPDSIFRSRHRTMTPARIRQYRSLLTPVTGDEAVRLVAALANYCWLLECESRQAVYNHGPYDDGTGNLMVVKEFLDLQGAAYPWMPEVAAELPRGTISVVVELKEWSGRFDILGTVHSEVDLGQMGLASMAILVDGERVSDPSAWMAPFLAQLQLAHRALFRVVARWQTADRFRAGPSTHARLWRSLLTSADVEHHTITSLVDEPLAEHINHRLADWPTEPGTDALWSWVGSAAPVEVFDPLIAVVNFGRSD